ncbi:MAG: hypothetical protein M3Z23_04105 [Acidobacteriota bacterium]|nr:hypothetical protein [Acidobacteriota bacterium]
MRLVLSLVAVLTMARPVFPATFGAVVTPKGGAAYSDLILDEPRGRIYLVNSTANRIEVYSIAQRTFLNPIKTDTQPVAAALSRSGKFLYVTAYTSSALDIIDLTAQSLTSRVTIPSSPEGVAVGGDDRVLITTIGSAGSQNNTLFIYDPNGPTGNNLTSVALPFPPPTPPALPPVPGRVFLSYRSKLLTTRDGAYIVGANGVSTNNRVVFVYEVASASVLRSRSVTSLSNVLSVSPDGSRFMAGSSLFDTNTLAVLAQENIANSPFAFPSGNANNFNLQQNQGGSVFAPDGSTLYAAFNIAPVQNPPARANVTRLLLNDPENLLIKLGLQLPENLAGRMEITSNGDTIYGISESGFVILPVGMLSQSPIAIPDSQVVFLATDQCGVTAAMNTVQNAVNNAGKGRLSVNAQAYTLPNTAVGGLGGNGGAGGGIIFPIRGGPGIIIPIGGGFPGGGGFGGGGTGAAPGTTVITPAAGATTPLEQTIPNGNGAMLRFQINPSAARTLGTVAPSDFLIQSPEAVNIPANVRVFQNTRDADARGTILPVPADISAGEGLMNLLGDTVRQRLYIANSGLNRVEVFDLRTKTFLSPIKVGQLPHSMAFGTDGNTLYVANTGGESVSVVDLDKAQTVKLVKFPPLPFNSGLPLVTPADIASSQRGPQMVMSDGTLWKIDGDQAVPRTLNPAVFGANVRTVAGGNPAVRTMASTPGGEYVLLVTGAGNAYLYDAGVDDYTLGRQIFTAPLTGFLGPITAGPKGQYYVANGTVLNASLTPISSAPVATGPVAGGTLPGIGGPNATASSRPISAVAAVNQNTYARFSQPIRASVNAAVTDAGIVELVDATTGFTTLASTSLEGAPSAVTGNTRVAVSGRTLYVDPNADYAYAVTASGLSVIPLAPVNPKDRPLVNNNGIVSQASYLPAVAPGSLIAIFGQNLGQSSTPGTGTLPTVLGGTCVTLNNQPLPLLLNSNGQINAQIPPTLAAGRYSLVVRSIDRQAASSTATVTVSKYAPAVFVSPGGQPAIVHQDGSAVTKDSPAKRDEHLILYATGLGPTHGGTVAAGKPAPSNPLAVTDKVQVFFGDPRLSQSQVIVEWSGLVPGYIGLNQINLVVPGAHTKGDALTVTIRIGGVNSPSTGPAVPKVAVQ